MTTLNTPTIGIGRLLSEGVRYVVPHHQRDYSWTEDEIEQLLNDILSAIAENSSEYFLGLMVFIPGEKQDSYNILDGQQRLVTTTMILSSIRSWLNQHGKIDDSEKLQGDFIGVREYGEKDLQPRMQLNANNNHVFYDYVINEKPIDEIEKEASEISRYDPNYDLFKGIIYCRNKINEIATSVNGSAYITEKHLLQMVKYIRDNIKVVRLVVPNEANAYTVFETLNARGLELSALDLVKNYLFGKAKSQINLQLLQNNWTEMMSNLLLSSSEDFLKVFWTSRFGRIQTSKLFNTLKKTHKTWESVSQLSSALVKASDQYEKIYISNSNLWTSFSKEVKGAIDALYVIDSKQLPPIILAALDRFNQVEMGKLLKFLEVLIVRYQLIMGGRTGLLEIGCARLAKKISDGLVTKASKAAKELDDIFPSDSAFRDSFLFKQERTAKKAHFILYKLEIEANRQGGTMSEFKPDISLTVEHILPKNPSQEWSDLFHDASKNIEDYKYRIGNLCLLDKSNRSLGSKSFKQKKQYYMGSSLLLTKSIGRQKDWNFKRIEERQKLLAELAIKVWPS